MNSLKTIPVIILMGFLAGCNLVAPMVTSTVVPTSLPTLEFSQPTVIQSASPTALPTGVSILPTPLSQAQAILDRSVQVVAALRDKDMASLASFISPQLGVRFSPYAAAMDSDQVIPANKMSGLLSDSTLYSWGAYSGTGEPISLTFADYYARFVYDVDFANAPQVSLNHRLGVSTTLDNAAEFYAGAMIVEYYFPGFDPALAGMDWRSLRLVFMQDGSAWYLVGIIHDQWTT